MDCIVLSIKSLEQQTKSVSLPRTASVLELKQKIQIEFDIDGTRQRLIFQGKVLRDGKNLSDYDNLNDGKVIHLVVRPMGVPHNPDNDEPSRNNRRRATTRQLSEGYAVITLDASLSDLEDGNSLMSTIMNSLMPNITQQENPLSPRQSRPTGLFQALRDINGSTQNSHEHSRPVRRLAVDGLLDMMNNRSSPITLPVPSSVEMRLSRTLSYIREIQTLLNSPIIEAENTRYNQTRHASVGAIRESRELLRQQENHASQVGLVVQELADLMILLTPWLREMGQSLRTEDNGRTSSQQLAHVLRTARIIQILSLIHHFLGSVLSTAETEDQPSTSNIPETWSPSQRQHPSPPPASPPAASLPAASSQSSSSPQPLKRKDHERDCNGSSSKRQRE